MTQTHIGRLKAELKRAAGALEGFEEFRSPVNHTLVAVAWIGLRQDEEIIRVAVREGHGTFYRGRITGMTEHGNWVVLADDGELVHDVTADTFVSVQLVPKPE